MGSCRNIEGCRNRRAVKYSSKLNMGTVGNIMLEEVEPRVPGRQ